MKTNLVGRKCTLGEIVAIYIANAQTKFPILKIVVLENDGKLRTRGENEIEIKP